MRASDPIVVSFGFMPPRLALALLLMIAVICYPVRLIHGQAHEGAPTPEFKLKDLSGKERRSSEFRGKILILDVWATWCEPCIEGIPMFNRLHDKYVGRGVEVVGIAVQSGSAQDIRRHVASLGIKYPVLVGNDEIVEKYVAVGFPITYLIGPDGKIMKKYTGSLPETETAKEMNLDEEIQNLLSTR